MDIIKKIELLRDKKRIRQVDFAKKIGLSHAGYSLILKKGDMKVSIIKKIADALGVPVTYFFEDSGKNESLIEQHIEQVDYIDHISFATKNFEFELRGKCVEMKLKINQ